MGTAARLMPRAGERQGVIIEGPVVTGQWFTEAVVSWNLDTPAGTGARVEMRVAGEEGAEWSAWLFLGEWGDVPPSGPRAVSDGVVGVHVDVDTLVCARPVRRYQWRVTATRGEWMPALSGRADHGFDEAVVVRRVAVVTTRELEQTEAGTERRRAAASRAQAAVALDVPFRSQRTPEPLLAGRLCSPTSVAMVLAQESGGGRPVHDVALRAFDARNDVFGNWAKNVQAAFSLGAMGYVTRVRDWNEVAGYLRRGVPVIASIRAGVGELRGAPYTQTGGHLIVITGLDGRGAALVNDPAVGTAARGRLRYRLDDLETVWFSGSAGTAYILGE